MSETNEPTPGPYPIQPPELPEASTKAEKAAESAREARIAEAHAALGEKIDSDGNVVPADPEGPEDPPVYDERGNVRPRGTEGAKPMTFKERVAAAKRTGAHPKDAPTPSKEGEVKP